MVVALVGVALGNLEGEPGNGEEGEGLLGAFEICDGGKIGVRLLLGFSVGGGLEGAEGSFDYEVVLGVGKMGIWFKGSTFEHVLSVSVVDASSWLQILAP